MRGKAQKSQAGRMEDGITPAYAGKRAIQVNRENIDEDHPRLCGEKFRIHLFITCQPGSPPPMRGKGLADETREYRTRITPAYAGKSITEIFQKDVNKDHPRLCGEKLLEINRHYAFSGSPPPMRGKGKSASRNDFPNRITPAYAGKSIFLFPPVR